MFFPLCVKPEGRFQLSSIKANLEVLLETLSILLVFLASINLCLVSLTFSIFFFLAQVTLLANLLKTESMVQFLPIGGLLSLELVTFFPILLLLIQTKYNYKIGLQQCISQWTNKINKVNVSTQIKVGGVQKIHYTYSTSHINGAPTISKPEVSKSIQSYPKQQICKSQYEEKIQHKILHKEDNIKTECGQSLIDDVLQQEQQQDNLKLENKKITKAQLRSKLQIVEKFIEEDRPIKGTKSITAPSSAQLQRCLKKLEQQFPNHELDFILSRLHMHLSHSCKEAANGIQNGLKMSSQRDQVIIDNCFTPAVLRNTDEKRIALSFLNHGYGLKILREIINDDTISPTKYNNIITTIMKNTFRMIETTVKQLKRNIISVGTQEERILRAPLVNCDKWLPQEQLKTFYNFVKGASGLDQVNISSESACKLYNSIIKQLSQRTNQERGCRDGRRRRRQIDFR